MNNPLEALFRRGGMGQGPSPSQPNLGVPAGQSGHFLNQQVARGNEEDLMRQLLQKEQERQAAEKQKALSLLGVGVAIGTAMNNGQGTMDNGRGGRGRSSGASPQAKAGGGAGAPASQTGMSASRGMGASGVTGAAKSGGRSRRDSGAAASKPAADASKVFPMDMMAGAGAASKAGFMASPMAAAGVMGGLDLVGGLLGGSSEDAEIQKKQLRQQGQQNLGQGIRSMSEMLRSRNAEMRNVLAGLGR